MIGVFAHNILSPRKHISKTYIVEIDIPLTEEMVLGFKDGVELIDGVCKASQLEILDKYRGKVILTEGRYHQIKRMFGNYGAKVVSLNRVAMGNLELPKDLDVGEIRELNEDEIDKIKENSITK
jgi:pseudouridylate synthase